MRPARRRITLSSSSKDGGTAGDFAAEQNKQLFACPFLSEGDVCDLQDSKPGICSDSLTLAHFEEAIYGDKPGRFFSHECGYLEGAPEEFVEAVRLEGAYNDHPINPEGEAAIKAKELAADVFNAAAAKLFDHRYMIKDGQWRKDKREDEREDHDTMECTDGKVEDLADRLAIAETNEELPTQEK